MSRVNTRVVENRAPNIIWLPPVKRVKRRLIAGDEITIFEKRSVTFYRTKQTAWLYMTKIK